MAAKYPTHPGPSGGKRHDEYTLDELLGAMAQRQQGELRDKQRRAEFLRAYESMKATPQEARDAEAAEYEKERIRSIWINAQEKLRQEEGGDQRADLPRSPESAQGEGARIRELLGRRKEALMLRMNALSGGGRASDSDAAQADAQITEWLRGGVAAKAAGKQWPPRERYGDKDLVEASGGELTIEDLERLHDMDPFSLEDDEVDEYRRLNNLRWAADKKITEDAPSGWYYQRGNDD
jgi:hypothetical protein